MNIFLCYLSGHTYSTYECIYIYTLYRQTHRHAQIETCMHMYGAVCVYVYIFYMYICVKKCIKMCMHVIVATKMHRYIGLDIGTFCSCKLVCGEQPVGILLQEYRLYS